jgi:ATP-binding cassette subfamily B protein
LALRGGHPVVTVACYIAFTFYAMEWRIGIRRRMNDSDTEANVKASICC